MGTSNDKPPRLPVKIQNIPSELKTLSQWCLWSWELREGRWTKPPYRPGGDPAKSNDPKTWASFEAVVKSYESEKRDGIGFMLAAPYVGIDLDSAIDLEGLPRDWARSIMNQIKSYSETSPSGCGYKILCKGSIPKGHHNERLGLFQQNRYFCITGHTLNGFEQIMGRQAELDALIRREWPQDFDQPQQERPKSSKADNEIIDKMLSASNGEKILKLFNGDWSNDFPSQSEGDQALVNHIVFNSQDVDQIDRIFRTSGLYRSKWDRPDYRQRTIKKALESVNPKYAEHEASTKGAPTMGELREYLDFSISEGQTFTADEICRALVAVHREHKKKVYADLSQLVAEKAIRKELYHHGAFRRIVKIDAYDLASLSGENAPLSIQLPLDLSKLISLKPKQLLQVSGRYDAGKSSFLFEVIANNHEKHRIIHIVSDELSPQEIKERMVQLSIPIGHPNITVYPMTPGYEDLIPRDPCIVILDYIRADENPYQIDAQIQRILRNLGEGVCIFGTQKHPGVDKPTGGQFAVNACHHVVVLDIWKELFICKILRSKSTKRIEGHLRVYSYHPFTRRLIPEMNHWKPGTIRWDKPKDPPKKTVNDESQQ